jgi:hypothetical protein
MERPVAKILSSRLPRVEDKAGQLNEIAAELGYVCIKSTHVKLGAQSNGVCD